MKKVLIISYYWPPSGGAGVQRWLKFVKYLRRFGWEPVVYTPENPEAPALDPSLEEDIPEGTQIIKTRIWEPFTIYKRFVGRKKDDKIKAGFLSEGKKASKAEKVSVWARGNLFIPDARKYWIKPSIRFLSNWLKHNPVDAIVSTGPPHSMHMIALGIKKKFDIPWLADFRDPWTNIDFYGDLMLTSFADKIHHRLEQKVLRTADLLTTVSENWADDFRKLGAGRIEVLTNGFDPDDFDSLSGSQSLKFEICHLGSMNKDRNPEMLWRALADLCKTVDGFKDHLKITFLGFTDYAVSMSLEAEGLVEFSETVKYLPHQEVLQRAKKAYILILPLNNTANVNGIIPGKLFEYLALKRPVFCIGDVQGDSARIITETKCGITVDFNDYMRIKNYLLEMFKCFQSDKPYTVESVRLEKYSRETLTERMASLLDQITEKNN